jgi:hypothetical protein
VIAPDALRPPLPGDPTATAYKDWLHLNLFDHASKAVGLVNVSLHGSPDDPSSRAVGAALLHVPDYGWAGNVEVDGFDEVAIGEMSIALKNVALAVDHLSRTVSASVRFPEDPLHLDVTARHAAPAIEIDDRVPLGNGWFSWYVIPRLTVSGRATVGDRQLDLAGASAYQDHNWGRWHWGDDLGWDWGAFMTPAPGPAIALVRTTNRDHTTTAVAALFAYVDGMRRSFIGPMLRVETRGGLDVKLRRVPGSLAALHSDRSQPRLPATIRLRADNGVDWVDLEFTARAAAQLIAADPAVRGYAFVHESVGEFVCAGRIRGLSFDGSGLGVVERAD